jgi:hypothetical protein
MNAANVKAAWKGLAPVKRLKRRQHGFALDETARRPGLPARVANAHARFEHEARLALREWLMV